MDFLRNWILPREQHTDTSEEFVPGWKSLFSPSDYFDFLNMVLAYLRRRQVDFTLRVDALYLGENGSRIDLEVLARQCAGQDRGQWRGTIEAYFQSSPAILAATKTPAHLDFSQIAPLLAICLQPTGTLIAVGKENLVYRVDLEETASVLMLDLPGNLQMVSPAEAASWGKEKTELFEISLENAFQQAPIERSTRELAPAIEVKVWTGSSPFTSVHTLVLSRHPEVIGQHGCLFAVPNRGTVICCPVDDERILATMGALTALVIEAYEGEPGSISPHLYWFFQGRYHFLPVDLRRKNISVSDGLNSLLKEVGPMAAG
ncbi:MAG TPA: hypothetical protein VMT46_15125 [Anaerolineaceae bacterium]|nr:hypothetical protein [Anaerolineaceae bacterium]